MPICFCGKTAEPGGSYSAWCSPLGKVFSEGTNPGQWPLCGPPCGALRTTVVCPQLRLWRACPRRGLLSSPGAPAVPIGRPVPRKETARLRLVRLRNQTWGLTDPGTPPNSRSF